MCPQCARPFDEFGSETQRLRDCPKCGGQFVDHSLLRDLLEARQVYGLRAARRPANPLEQPVRYRPCPVCGTMMNRQNFGRSSGIIVDICSRHGVWFDAGELPRVLDFVQSGGLQRAEQQRQPHGRSPHLQTFGDPLGGPPLASRDALSAGSPLADAAAELMAAVRHLLRG
jgi:Zn-finger nucleic acid-binding protein